MLILVVNAGSSSLKYQLIDMDNENVLAKGNCDRIGIDGHISHKTGDGRKLEEDCSFPTHTEAFEKLVETLTKGEGAVIKDMNEISAVGHRIVQGAEVFDKPTMVTDEVIEKIDEMSELAPVHNHPHALALRACKKVFSESVPQVAVFDTAFHQTIPEKAFIRRSGTSSCDPKGNPFRSILPLLPLPFRSVSFSPRCHHLRCLTRHRLSDQISLIQIINSLFHTFC